MQSNQDDDSKTVSCMLSQVSCLFRGLELRPLFIAPTKRKKKETGRERESNRW